MTEGKRPRPVRGDVVYEDSVVAFGRADELFYSSSSFAQVPPVKADVLEFIADNVDNYGFTREEEGEDDDEEEQTGGTKKKRARVRV